MAGPIPQSPSLVVAAGVAPFETKVQSEILKRRWYLDQSDGQLFHEIQDDRYVLEAALAGRADIMATANLADFNRRDAVQLTRDDLLLYPTAERSLVIAKPSFVAHWMRQGFVPDTRFVLQHPGDFQRREK
jgi:hypothetical protein